MKKVKTSILVVILMILSTFVIGVAAESAFIKNQIKTSNSSVSDQPLFFTEISFKIVINDGCGCNPIEGVTVAAFGGAGNDVNVTNIDGTCILVLEIDSIYTVEITAEGYVPIIFEFVVIDEQYFVFEMSIIEDSVNSNFQAFQHIIDLLTR
jgi:hypothetical protein